MQLTDRKQITLNKRVYTSCNHALWDKSRTPLCITEQAVGACLDRTIDIMLILILCSLWYLEQGCSIGLPVVEEILCICSVQCRNH